MSQNIEVLEKLLARAKGEKDNYKIGLVLPGGGMRGVFSGGGNDCATKTGSQ